MSPAEVIARALQDELGADAEFDQQITAAILAALNAAGLAVVPVEPTRQMIHALRGYAQCAGYAPKTYRAMVAVEQATKECE
jgi:hypothetical protein